MKNFSTINENELDGALNALFLEKYSRKEDEELARFCMEQDFQVLINSKKEAALLARLNGKQGGGKNILLWSLSVLLLSVLSIVLYNINSSEQKVIATSSENSTAYSESVESSTQTDGSSALETTEEKLEQKIVGSLSPFNVRTNEPTSPAIDSLEVEPVYIPKAVPEPVEEKVLPYFNKEGLAYFAKIKKRILQKLVKIDDVLYGKTAPGSTMYKNSEVIVPPFVMSNFPVTNLEYKTFLADLVMQGRFEDMKKCLPKEEVWKEYGCNNLAKNYFSNEIYNDFPVVNINTKACAIYCEWLQEECNQELAISTKKSKTKSTGKKKQVIVRLPYDYEWIYSADAAYALIPDCSGYNTIYDPSEGLVDKGFYKRTSQVNKIDKSKETPMDKLSDVNRFGMSEEEIIAIFKKAINYKDVKSKSTGNPAAPESYPDNIEACCLAGHVSELIKSKEGEMKVRGCCWKDKEEYLKMMDVYNKNGASPFIGFRVVILNTERGSDKDPFW